MDSDLAAARMEEIHIIRESLARMESNNSLGYKSKIWRESKIAYDEAHARLREIDG